MSATSAGIDALFPWQGATPANLEMACTQIARRLIACGQRWIGFVPAPGTGDLLPLLVRFAAALYPFQQRPVAVIPAWSAWDMPPPGAARLGNDDLGPTLRSLPGDAGPTLVVPPPAPDASTAGLSLELALRRLDQASPRALIDLTGLPGIDPPELAASVRLCDAAAVVGTCGQTKVAALRRMARLIPAEKNLGAVLIG